MKKFFLALYEAVTLVLGVLAISLIMAVGGPWFLIDRFRQYLSGYFVESWGGREPDDGTQVTYIEQGKSIMFFGNNTDWIIRVPTESLWVEIMPEWAKFRRDEIVERIKRRERRFVYQETDNREDLRRIVCSDKSMVSGSNAFKVKR